MAAPFLPSSQSTQSLTAASHFLLSRTTGSGSSPLKTNPLPTPLTQRKAESETAVKLELNNSLFQVPFDSFRDAFLGQTPAPPSPSGPARRSSTASLRALEDSSIAARCLAAMSSPKSSSDGAPLYADGGFRLPPAGSREKQYYSTMVEMLRYIKGFYYDRRPDVHADWSSPLPPNVKRPRNFYDLHNKTPNFSASPKHFGAVNGPEPDIAMMVETEGYQDTPYWMDIRLPIEIKPTDNEQLDQELAGQVGNYARCMKMEQFDRRFLFAMDMNRSFFRLWRFDAACAYVSQAINYHERPLDFIMTIQRFISMTPADLGYDIQFQHAGTAVFGDELQHRLLSISPSSVVFADEDNDESDSAASGTEGSEHNRDDAATLRSDAQPDFVYQSDLTKPRWELVVDTKVLSQARTTLFSRSTTVFEGRASGNVQSSPSDDDEYAIKQNWQDALRFPEPATHQAAHGCRYIPPLETWEKVYSTRDDYDRVKDDILGWFTYTVSQDPYGGVSTRWEFIDRTASSDIPVVCHRVLLRMVFRGVGVPLTEVENGLQLLRVVRCGIRGLRDLRDRGIVHRDISLGNILISRKDKNEGMLIDLGLAMFVGGGRRRRSAIAHHHLTGTLPYIALQILTNKAPKWKPLVHDICHDLESFFWLLYHASFVGFMEERMPMPEEVLKTLRNFHNMNTDVAAAIKYSLLSNEIPVIVGKFGCVIPSLAEFRELCHEGTPAEASWTDPAIHPVQGEPVECILTKHISLLESPPKGVLGSPPASPNPGSPVPETPNAGSRATSPKRRCEDDQNVTPSSRRRKLDVASTTEPRTPALKLPPKTGE